MHLKRKFNILFSLIKEYFVQTKLFRLIFIIVIRDKNISFFFLSIFLYVAFVRQRSTIQREHSAMISLFTIIV